MSHQSGIKPNADLVKLFNQSNEKRALKLEIINEDISCTHTAERSGNFSEDFDLVESWLEEACFILYRMDGSGWILFLYVPENSPVRFKMLYSSTKNTLIKELGSHNFAHQIFCSVRSEVTYAGFMQYETHITAKNPLTEREEEMQAILSNQDLSARPKEVQGLEFPLSEDAIAAITNISESKLTVESETIDLLYKGNREFGDYGGIELVPCFVFHLLGPSEVFFAYISPPSINVKQRMMFAASKGAMLSRVQLILGFAIDKKYELDSFHEINQTLISVVPTPKPMFAKPAKPKRK